MGIGDPGGWVQTDVKSPRTAGEGGRTGAVEVAVAGAEGGVDEAADGGGVHPPDAEPHGWHLVAAAQHRRRRRHPSPVGFLGSSESGLDKKKTAEEGPQYTTLESAPPSPMRHLV